MIRFHQFWHLSRQNTLEKGQKFELLIRINIHMEQTRCSVNFSSPGTLHVFIALKNHSFLYPTTQQWRGFMVSRWTSVVRPSARLSVFRFRMITWVNINGFSPNFLCALILWRSGWGLLMGKFRQIFTELSTRDTHIFSFPDDNLGK